MSMGQTRRVLYDLTLTIEVHPLALGVIPESTEQVALPNGVVIEAMIVSNIVRYHETDPPCEDVVKLVTVREGEI